MNSKCVLPTVTRRRLLKGAAATAALWAGREATIRAAAVTSVASPGNQPIPSGSITQVPLTVSSTAFGQVGSGFVGLAYPKEKISGTLFTNADSTLIGIFKRLGPSIFRLGGSSTDTCVWSPNGSGGMTGLIAPADVDNLAAFVKAIGWKCIYGINLGGAAAGATNPTMAGEEAAYVAKMFGDSLHSIEIGNEPDYYGRVGNPWANNWTFDQFVAIWEEYRRAILIHAPTVAISGPADGGDPLTWTIPFAEVVTSQKINLLTQHYYVKSVFSPQATTTELLQVGLHKDLVEELAALNTASERLHLPFRMNECGDFYSSSPTVVQPNVAGSYTAALWSLDYMFMCAQGGAQGVNFESGGMVSGFPPILNDANSVIEICPLYYGLLLFTLAGTGSCLKTTVSSGSLNINGYAIKKPNGGLSIVVLNKEQTANVQMQIQLPHGVSQATLMQMTQQSPGITGPDLMATSGVSIQSAQVQTDGTFSPAAAYELLPGVGRLTCFVPPLSAILIDAA